VAQAVARGSRARVGATKVAQGPLASGMSLWSSEWNGAMAAGVRPRFPANRSVAPKASQGQETHP